MEILGIDMGGSGIKGAPVNVETGELAYERYRLPTPEAARPEEVAATVQELVEHFDWKGPAGVGFPAAVQNGVVRTAANIHKTWIGTNAAALFTKRPAARFTWSMTRMPPAWRRWPLGPDETARV